MFTLKSALTAVTASIIALGTAAFVAHASGASIMPAAVTIGPSKAALPVIRIAEAGADEDTVASGGTTAVATFASGCFWCTESDFDKVPGVLKTISGFTGGKEKNPTYRQVVSGQTGHTEAVQVTYDPTQVSYEKLLDTYWRNVDPFDLAGQFCDRGTSYRPAIFTHSEKQQELALASRKELNASGRFEQKIKLPVTPVGPFYAAEAKHQNFYKKNAFHYYRYRTGCGRDRRLQQIWGKSAS